MTPETFRCFLVDKDEQGNLSSGVVERPLADLPPGEVLIRVARSSLNYKDALAATGHPGITKNFPHVPGIDSAGSVVESTHPRWQPGDEVVMTGHELGVERWGGWAEYVRVPGDWPVPLPEGLSLEESMILGTAGFTAAQCVEALLHEGVPPGKGEILVTGATGGVGSLAVMILAKLGYDVVAVTGKSDRHDWLKSLGAGDVVGRELLEETRPRPLLSARFAGGVDTVGGSILSSMVKMIDRRGCVACCGLAGGAELALTVYPFILRGVRLIGIDSAWCPEEERRGIWSRLAADWKPERLELLKTPVPLREIDTSIERILNGRNVGRVVVDVMST